LMVLRIIRLTRIFRAFKVSKYSEVVQMLGHVFRRSSTALYCLGFYLTLAVCIFSSLLYYAELGEWDPVELKYMRTGVDGIPKPTPFESIPATLWWAVVTVTTVGYGDLSPQSAPGKVVAAITMVVGVLTLAMPMGVIGNNFTAVWREFEMDKRMRTIWENEDKKAIHDSQFRAEPLENIACQLTIEVWDEDCCADGAPPDHQFLGEAVLKLPLEERVRSKTQHKLTIHPNKSKSRAKGTGKILVEVEWIPTANSGLKDEVAMSRSMTFPLNSFVQPRVPALSVTGSLAVRVISASGLMHIDWKPSGLPDPFVQLICYPKGLRNSFGDLQRMIWRSSTVGKTNSPLFDAYISLNYEWASNEIQPRLTHDGPIFPSADEGEPPEFRQLSLAREGEVIPQANKEDWRCESCSARTEQMFHLPSSKTQDHAAMHPQPHTMMAAPHVMMPNGHGPPGGGHHARMHKGGGGAHDTTTMLLELTSTIEDLDERVSAEIQARNEREYNTVECLQDIQAKLEMLLQLQDLNSHGASKLGLDMSSPFHSS